MHTRQYPEGGNQFTARGLLRRTSLSTSHLTSR